MDFEILAVAAVAALVIMRLVEVIVKPIWEQLAWPAFWLRYVSLAIGAALAWFTGLNGFPVFGVEPLVGRVLTCLAVGIGPSFIFELTDKK